MVCSAFFLSEIPNNENVTMIAREAFWYTAPVLLLALIMQFNLALLAIPLWLLLFVLLYLFRTPKPELSSDPLAVVCPVNSTVSQISQISDPYLERESIRVEFEMAVLDIFTLLSATEGKIMNFWKGLPHSSKDSNNPNSKTHTVWIQTDEKDDLVIEVHPSRSGQLMCYSAAGERVGQGKKCGFLPFGSKVAVYLPKECKLEVASGDRVTAGVDIIARWPRS